MVRRPALPAPEPLPKAMAGEAEGTGLCPGLAGAAPASPTPWGWVPGTLWPDPDMRKGPVSPTAPLLTALLTQTQLGHPLAAPAAEFKM